jgi:phage portal protein BeeE
MTQMKTNSEYRVLAEGASFEANQLTFSEMDLVNLLNTTVRAIASAFEVDASYLNVEGTGGLAEKRAADRILHVNVIRPRIMWLVEQLQVHLRRDLDPKTVLEIDETNIPHLQDDQLEKLEKLAGRGAITINEYRTAMGMDPIPDGDKLITPAGTAVEESKEPEAAQEAPKKPREVGFNADTSRRATEKRLAQ